MENITLTIDEKRIICEAGTTLLEAAQQSGIKIPTLCSHPDLKPLGACRLCLVEDEKTGRLMASCVSPAVSDMRIQTATARILQHRRNIARLMMAEHPESCLVCNKGNRCQLRTVASQMGLGDSNLYAMPNPKPLEQANPFFIRDLSKCILCGKCIRADHELVVVGAIDYNLRGFKSRPATAHDVGLEQSSCTFCGTCVSICPTGALSHKNNHYVGSPAHESFSICGFCGIGCRLSLGAVDHKIIEVNPSRQSDSVNNTTLCVRGHFAHDFLNNAHRLISPLIRKNGTRNDGFAPASWDEAIALVANRLMAIKNENGPQSIAFLGSSKCTNEENYLFQKMARVIFGTNNVENGGYVYGQHLLSALEKKTAGRCRVNRLAELETAEVICVLGADPNHSLPVAGYYLKRAARHGIPIIVVDPRKTDLVPFASLWLPVKPQGDLEMINALAAQLIEKGAYDASFIDRHTKGFSLFRYSLATLDFERVQRVTGLNKDELQAAADLIGQNKTAFVIGNGILQQRYGQYTLEALLNLALMSDNLGTPGNNFYLLAKENNQVGALDMGTAPHLFPGRLPLRKKRVIKVWEEKWNTKLSQTPGFNLIEMINAAEKGHLKGLYVMGENPLRALPQSKRVQKALKKLEFLVVQDILHNETTPMADAVLPGAAFSEKGGSFTSMEGRIQTFRPVVPPPGNAKADWEILDLLSTKLSSVESYASVEKIRAEIRQLVPMYADLNGEGTCWINPAHPDSTHHPQNENDLIAFAPVVSTIETSLDPEYPFTAIIGSLRHHLGCGTRTAASERIREFDQSGYIEISPEDAEELNLVDGASVNLVSPDGDLKRILKIKPAIRPGLLFVPLAIDSNDALSLIGLNDLADPDTDGWKSCQVRIEKI